MSKTHKALLQVCENEIKPQRPLLIHEFTQDESARKPLMVGTRTISRKQIVCYAEMAILRSAKSCGG